MSLAITHFVFGALCATFLLAYLPIRTRYGFTVAIVSGIWAMMPDFWRVAPVGERLFREFGHSVYGNIFWIHPLLDELDRTDSHYVGAAMVGVYLVVSLVHAERRRESPVFEISW